MIVPAKLFLQTLRKENLGSEYVAGYEAERIIDRGIQRQKCSWGVGKIIAFSLVLSIDVGVICTVPCVAEIGSFLAGVADSFNYLIEWCKAILWQFCQYCTII